MSDRPFIFKFVADEKFYVYDVPTNTISSVNDVEFALADQFDPSGPEIALAALGACFTPSQIHEGWSRMKNLADNHGVLTSRKPGGLAFSLCSEHLNEQLTEKMGQMILNVTEQCNLRCSYCTYSGHYAHERSHQSRYMTRDTANAALAVLFRHSAHSSKVTISFYGGEPLLNLPLIKHVIARATQECTHAPCSFFVDTNGTLLSTSTIAYLREHQVYLQITLDGPPHVHDRYRRFADGRTSFDTVAAALTAIHRAHPEYFESRVSLAVTAAPPYDLIGIKEFFDSSGITPRVLKINFVNRLGCDFDAIYSDALASSHMADHWQRLRQQFIDEKTASSDNVRSLVLRDLFQAPLIKIHRRDQATMPDLEHPNGICVPGGRRVFVTVDGDFYMCERVGPSGRIGNVSTGLDTAAIHRLIDQYIEASREECRHCWAVRLCGLCFTSVLDRDRIDLTRKRLYCEWERDTLAEGLVIYATVMSRNPHAFDYMKNMLVE